MTKTKSKQINTRRNAKFRSSRVVGLVFTLRILVHLTCAATSKYRN